MYTRDELLVLNAGLSLEHYERSIGRWNECKRNTWHDWPQHIHIYIYSTKQRDKIIDEMRESVCVCVCVCVRERARETDIEGM